MVPGGALCKTGNRQPQSRLAAATLPASFQVSRVKRREVRKSWKASAAGVNVSFGTRNLKVVNGSLFSYLNPARERPLQYVPDLQAKFLDGRNVADIGHPSNLLRYLPVKGRNASVTHRSPAPSGGRQCSNRHSHFRPQSVPPRVH